MAFKDGYHRLGALLAAAGRLPDADAVCFLTHEELGQLVQGAELAAVAPRELDVAVALLGDDDYSYR